MFHESSDFVAQKTRAALDAGLSVILCIGETLEEREGGKTVGVCGSQLSAVVEVLKESDWRYVSLLLTLWHYQTHPHFLFLAHHFISKIVIAYEPVWAIGTGKVATTSQAQETHRAIREFLSKSVSPGVAESTRIIYGGSVTAKNCKELCEFFPLILLLIAKLLMIG